MAKCAKCGYDSKNAKDDFISLMKENPAYSHIDIDRELSKMDAWFLVNPNRQKTKRFVMNWLNKIEKPLGKQPIQRMVPMVERAEVKVTVKERQENLLKVKKLMGSIGGKL